MPRLATLLGALTLALVVTGCSDDTTDGGAGPTIAPAIVTSTTAAPLPDAGEPLAPNAVVDRVVDGDTIVVEIEGRSERVRLLGIDTPESVAENRPDQCYGAEAGVFLEVLLPAGTPITLIRDVEARDQYDRLLAYVVRSDDQLFVNLHLVQQGYADALIYDPNTFYADALEQAARDAARAGVGLWGVCGGPDVPLS